MILEFQNMPTGPLKTYKEKLQRLHLFLMFFSGFDIQAATVQLS